MVTVIKQKTKKLKNGKKKIIIEVNKELTELTESERIKIDIYLSSADEIEIITPSDKIQKEKEKERKRKNNKPETNIKNDITKKDMEDYIKSKNTDGLDEYNNQDFTNYMEVKKWFFNKYPNYIQDKLKNN